MDHILRVRGRNERNVREVLVYYIVHSEDFCQRSQHLGIGQGLNSHKGLGWVYMIHIINKLIIFLIFSKLSEVYILILNQLILLLYYLDIYFFAYFLTIKYQSNFL